MLFTKGHQTMQKPNQTRGTKEDTAKVVLVIISIKGTKAATQQQREILRDSALSPAFGLVT